MTAITTETKDRALLTFVQKLKENDDRGTLALLRGALSNSGERQMRAWRVLARFGGIPTDDPHMAEVVRTVAGLLALPGLRHLSNGQSFGDACTRRSNPARPHNGCSICLPPLVAKFVTGCGSLAAD